VIVARSGATTPDDNGVIPSYSKIVLKIEKIVKGKCDAGEVTVFYIPNMICPMPDQYPFGKTVLAFLAWDDKRKGYIAPGLSYASKALEADDLKLYLERIGELSQIPEEKRAEKPSDETVDWLVRCIEHPSTRWEGAYEFFGPMIWLKRSPEDRPPEPVDRKRLSKGQWKRLRDSFLASKSFGAGEDLLAMMLTDVPDTRIDDFLVEQLSRELKNQAPRWGGHLMKRLAERKGQKDLSQLAAKYESLDLREQDEERLKLITDFLRVLSGK
jgi:hypothetical protein